MGRQNDAVLSYLEAADRFADVYNAVCFQGKQVIRAEDLEEASEGYSRMPENRGRKEKPAGSSRARDLKKRLKNGASLRILGIEAQSYVDYAMPLRSLDYDVQEYMKQLRKKKRENRAAEVCRTKNEYLSGLRRSDRLHPVYTVCLYHGDEEWDGPLTLRDMMDFEKGDDFSALFKDYPLTLIRADEPMDYSLFRTPVRELFQVLALRKDKERLRCLAETDPAYRNLDRETMEVIAVMTNNRRLLEHPEEYENEEGGYDMCEALEGIKEDGRLEGIKQGIKQGIKRGIEQGEEYGRYREIYDFLQAGRMSLEEAARWKNMTVEELTEKFAALQIGPL